MAKMIARGALTSGAATMTGSGQPLGGLTSYGASRLLELTILGQRRPGLELALYVLGADGDNDSILEVSSPGYRRVAVTFTVADDQTLSNTFDVVVGPVVGLTPFTGAGITDGTDIWWFDDNVSGAVTDGNTVTFPAGTIVLGANI